MPMRQGQDGAAGRADLVAQGPRALTSGRLSPGESLAGVTGLTDPIHRCSGVLVLLRRLGLWVASNIARQGGWLPLALAGISPSHPYRLPPPLVCPGRPFSARRASATASNVPRWLLVPAAAADRVVWAGVTAKLLPYPLTPCFFRLRRRLVRGRIELLVLSVQVGRSARALRKPHRRM